MRSVKGVEGVLLFRTLDYPNVEGNRSKGLRWSLKILLRCSVTLFVVSAKAFRDGLHADPE